MGDVNEASLLDYFCSSRDGSGRVKNADILRTFKPFIGHADAQLRGKSVNRESARAGYVHGGMAPRMTSCSIGVKPSKRPLIVLPVQ